MKFKPNNIQYLKRTIIAIVTLLGFGVLYAQEALPATGGGASGIGGTVSYSIGQLVNITNIGTNGSVRQGVQQPFEISKTLDIAELVIQPELAFYPNPTDGYLTLKVENFIHSNLIFQLYDILGKLLINKKIVNSSTVIKMEKLPSSTYLLLVTDNRKFVKIFRILKN